MNEKYKKALMFTFAITIFIALFDIWAMNSGIFGTPENYVKGSYVPGWWPLFFKINIAVITLISLFYYFVIRKDKSETIGVFISSLVLFFSGLPDILFFLLQGQKVPMTLPWLNGSPIISKITALMGYETVTSITLAVSVVICFVSLVFIDKLLGRID